MAITAKPTEYTVNTGHAYAPTHLWMCDEGSGTTVADQGTGTAQDMTLQNADMWGTDGTLGAKIGCISATSRYALSATGAFASTSLLMVVICKPASAVCAATEYVLGGGHDSDTAAAYCGPRFVTTEIPEAIYYDGTAAAASKVWSAATYDTNWQMIAAKYTTNSKSISVDGAAWATVSATSYDFPNASGKVAPNRWGLGCRPHPTPSGPFNGDILAAWTYYDGTYADWNDAWIAALYDNPWQFLNTIKAFQYRARANPLLRM